MKRLIPGPLYPITPPGPASGRTHVDWARLFLEQGVRVFQVREKHLAANSLLEQLVEIQQLCILHNGAMIVNDRVDLALASGAAGVHLGQLDLPVDAARGIAGSKLLIGLSTHSREEFLLAQDLPVDYVAIGPVYDSPTKPATRKPLGLTLVSELAAAKRLPMVAIGGIDLARARRLWNAGVDSVAVISDVAGAPDPRRKIDEYLEAGQR